MHDEHSPNAFTDRRFAHVRSPTISLVTTLSILSLAACAGKEQAAADTAAKTAQSGDPSPSVVTVTAKDFAFEAPTEIPAGLTTFKLTNDSKNFHHMIIVRLDSGKTASDFVEARKKPGPFPAWAVIMGGPNAPSPSQQSNATFDIQPGNYVMFCGVDIPDGIPHIAKGMFKPLTVTASAGPAAKAPTPDVSIGLKEYAFEVSTPITAGSHVLEVRNTGAQDHEIEIIKLEPGKTIDDFGKWMAKPAGPPPASAVGGVIAGKGGQAYFTADFTPGNYVMLCFIPDAKDGKSHMMHGMVQNFTVN